MSLWSKIRGTVETIFQIGKAGPQLKNNTGVIEARNAADGDFAVVRGASPVGGDDFITKTYFDANNAASVGLNYKELAVAQSTVVSSDAIPDNCRIRDVLIQVTTIYNNSPTLAGKRTGDASKALFATGDVDLTALGDYHIPQAMDWGSTGAGTVTLTVGGTPNQGVCKVFIGYTTPDNIA